MHMLRDIEKQTITQGMYVRFILGVAMGIARYCENQ